jgi:hypothetical protein
MKITCLILFAACLLYAPARASSNVDHTSRKTQPAKTSYGDVKLAVGRLRSRLTTGLTLNDTTQLEKYFVQVVTESILPYWYGTAWDFNGTTQTPGNGAIACGYFVSTVLRDAGLPVNRVKMGQMSSEEMTWKLAEKKDVKLFYENPLPGVMAYLRQRGQGLYIIGLDCHVGFILVDAKGCWFIHSKWFGEKAVVKEDAATSGILYYSKYRMVAKISNSKKLLRAWLYGDAL